VTSPPRILLLEDDSRDAALIQELLEADNILCEVTHAQTRAEYLSGLEDPAIDLILADYKLPSFDGLAALRFAQNMRPGLPFIFVSGTLGEEAAIEALKTGATDYVLKSRLSRLTPAVNRALREAGDRAQRKRAEEALQRSEMYLAEAQSLSHTGSFGWDILSGEIYWSDETYRIFEIEPTTKPTVQMVLDRTHPDDRLYLRQVIERVVLERRDFSAEHRLRTPNGSVKHVRVVARRAASEDPERVIFAGAVTDITERKRVEETLREQADLLDLTHDAIFVRDMDGIVRNWNRGAEVLYGWMAVEAQARPVSELLKTVSHTPLDHAIAELLQTGRWDGELLRSRKDGTQVVVASRWSLQRDTRGNPVAVLETNNDITERKRAEEALSEINDRFRVLAESSLSGIYLIQEDLFRYVNPAMATMFGYAVEDVVDRLGPRELVYPDDRPLVLENIRRRIEGDMEEIRYECRGLRKDGSAFPVEVHGRRIEHGGRTGIVGTLVDNTDRRRAEDALRTSEQRFRDYAEIASDWFWESGPDHRFSRFSGKPPDRGVSGKFIGSRRWELAADREDEPEKWRTHLAALDAHQPFRGFRYRIARPDGSALYLSVSGKPLFEVDGKFLGYRGTAADVAAEVRAEQAEQALREAQAELAHVTRVMSLSALSASIAHELNQPIGAVINDARAGLNWLDKPSPNLPEAKEALESIVKSANRGAEVIERIRALTKKAPVQKIELNINEVILEVTALTRVEIHRNHVTLRTQLANELPPVQADRIEFQQVMLNLIINAIEAMEESARRDLLIASRKDGSKVRVEVCDSGQGLKPEIADHIFQPFFTTKSSGMGMGLAICRTIVERIGGKLSARANAPCGTVFELIIPHDSNHLLFDPMS
jgi:PAS domain S-box-containing protein